MTQIIAYYPNPDNQKKVLPKLLESIVAKGFRIHITCDSQERIQELDSFLWTYEQLSFLPHSTSVDSNLSENPIVISQDSEIKNNATVLVSDDMSIPKNYDAFEKIVFIVNDNEHDKFEGIKLIAQTKKLTISNFVQSAKGWEKKKAA